MAHGGPSFALRLKTHKVKIFHKRFNQEILKSTQLENHRNNHRNFYDFYVIMIIPIIELNPKNSMSICFIESREIILVDFLRDILFKSFT